MSKRKENIFELTAEIKKNGNRAIKKVQEKNR